MNKHADILWLLFSLSVLKLVKLMIKVESDDFLLKRMKWKVFPLTQSQVKVKNFCYKSLQKSPAALFWETALSELPSRISSRIFSRHCKRNDTRKLWQYFLLERAWLVCPMFHIWQLRLGLQESLFKIEYFLLHLPFVRPRLKFRRDCCCLFFSREYVSRVSRQRRVSPSTKEWFER